jgi:hypothetical protein
LKSQRDFRNYLAGAALAFGVVLLVSQVLQLLYGGLALADRESVYTLIMGIYITSHIVGGGLGGYLVARVRRTDYILTGTVTAVLAYIFEFAYNLIVEATLTDIYAMVSLLIGAIIGTMFMRAKMENERMTGLKRMEKADSNPQP